MKIKSLEAAKIIKIKWLVLGCIEADFCKKIFVGKLLTRSTRFTCKILHRSDLNISTNFVDFFGVLNMRNATKFDFFKFHRDFDFHEIS